MRPLSDFPGKLLVGTSPGKKNLHVPEHIPFDTVTYLLRAEQMRQRFAVNGVFFALDERVFDEKDTADTAAIENRTDRLRDLVTRVAPAFSFVTHSELMKDGRLPERLKEDTNTYPELKDEELKEYTRLQTATVRALLLPDSESSHDETQPLDRRYKFGWIASRRKDGPHGGEVSFDQHLPSADRITPMYTAPAYNMGGKHAVRAPYLFQRSDSRVCVPESPEGIEAEMEKIVPGIRQIHYKTLLRTARVILGEEKAGTLERREIVRTPPPQSMTDNEITSPAAITFLRDKLGAALDILTSKDAFFLTGSPEVPNELSYII